MLLDVRVCSVKDLLTNVGDQFSKDEVSLAISFSCSSYRSYLGIHLVVSREPTTVYCCLTKQNHHSSCNKMPCYRKDDRAMRPIAYMGGLKIFGSPWIAMPI